MTYANKKMRWKSTKQEREIDEETYKIWTKTLPVSKLGEVRLVIAEKVADEDEKNPVKYLATSKIDAPSAHIIRNYSYRWRIETFFEDSKQGLGLGDCEVRDSDDASRYWHLQMLTDSLLRLGSESSVLERLVPKASSLRAQLEHDLKEAIYNMFSRLRRSKVDVQFPAELPFRFVVGHAGERVVGVGIPEEAGRTRRDRGS